MNEGGFLEEQGHGIPLVLFIARTLAGTTNLFASPTSGARGNGGKSTGRVGQHVPDGLIVLGQVKSLAD